MFHPNSPILYVADVPESMNFYRNILSVGSVKAFEVFSLSALCDGFMPGLQGSNAITLKTHGKPGCIRLCLAHVTANVVDALYQAWKARGVRIIQELIALDFGYTSGGGFGRSPTAGVRYGQCTAGVRSGIAITL